MPGGRHDPIRRAGLRGLVALAFGPASRAAFAQTRLELVELDERLAVVTGAGANVTVGVGPDALVLVDTGHAEHADALIELLARRWPGKPVRTVFNTNWRAEHTGANAAFRVLGARVFAHENTKLWMGARFDVPWQGLAHAPSPASALPNYTFYGAGELELGDETVAYGILPRAHTDGDVYVHFRSSDVLVASDLLTVHGYPVLDHVTGGWIGGMRDATRALLALCGDATRIVPAEGVAQRRAALEAQLELLEHVLRQVAMSYRSGGSLEDFLGTAPAAEFAAERGDPTEFLELVYEGAYPYVRELGGII